MRSLSKKNMLVSLLALSLAACTTTTRTTIPQTTSVPLECDGDAGENNVALTTTFKLSPNASSTCDLVGVYFIKETKHQNYKLFNQHASGATHVDFGYTGPPQVPGDGAYFYYITKGHSSPSPDGGGGGVIH